MSTEQERVNIPGLQSKAADLDLLFSDFAKLLKDINDTTNELVHVDPNSAFYGNVGSRLLNLWNQNAATFSEFKDNFKMWSDTIAAITAKDKETIAKVIEIYSSGNGSYDSLGDYIRGEFASNGSELSGVAEKRDAKYSEDSFYGADIQFDKVEITSVVDTSYTGGTKAPDGAYQIATEGRTADEMYQDALDLEGEIYTEIEYLSGYRNDLLYAKSALDNAYKTGNPPMDDVDYFELSAEYNARIEACDTEIGKRSEIYNSLNEITADNFGTNDGVLKDARDFSSNDLTAAKESLYSINQKAGELSSLSSISLETNPDGTTKNAYSLSALYSSEMNGNYGSYAGNIDSVATYSNPTVSNLTLKSAYTAAGNNVIELESDKGVYLFNTADYLYASGEINPMGIVGINESSNLSLNNYQGMDSVYDSNTGKFYTYDEWNALKQ